MYILWALNDALLIEECIIDLKGKFTNYTCEVSRILSFMVICVFLCFFVNLLNQTLLCGDYRDLRYKVS